MTDAWAAWEAKHRVEVELPSGMQVRLVLPEPDALVRRGLFPTALSEIAVRMAAVQSRLDARELTEAERQRLEAELVDLNEQADPEQRRALNAAQDELVCQAVVEARPDDGSDWQPISLDADKLRRIPGDAAALRAVVQRDTHPEAVTAVSRYNRGLMSADKVAEVYRRVGTEVSHEWASFRALATGMVGSPNSGEVRPTPIGAHRRERPRRRARTG